MARKGASLAEQEPPKEQEDRSLVHWRRKRVQHLADDQKTRRAYGELSEVCSI